MDRALVDVQRGFLERLGQRRVRVADPPAGAPPPPSDDFADPPWHEDCQLPFDDDTSQVPPDAEI